MSGQAERHRPQDAAEVAIDLSAVVLTVMDDEPQILLAPPPGDADAERQDAALPSGPFTPALHRTLEEGLRDWVAAQTGLRLGYVEQLYTFADRYRDPRELSGGPRRLSIGYLALLRRPRTTALAAVTEAPGAWRPLYGFLPWEDRRAGPPALLDEVIRPRLREWVAAGLEPTIRAERRGRVEAAFPDDRGDGRDWDPVPALERYELLYECELTAEARRDAWARALHAARALGAELPPAPPHAGPELGPAMRHDHRRILATALGRLRARLAYRPLLFELLPPAFTLSQLQGVAEALTGLRLHKQNFRRVVADAGLVEPTGAMSRTGGRPAALFRFRRGARPRHFTAP